MNETLRTERDVLKQLLATLQAEQEALVRFSPERLAELGQSKLALLEQLSAVKRNGTDSATPGSKKELDWLTNAVRQTHRANGALIDTGLRYTRRALATLHAGANSNGIYGPDGQARSSGESRARVSV